MAEPGLHSFLHDNVFLFPRSSHNVLRYVLLNKGRNSELLLFVGNGGEPAIERGGENHPPL